MGRSGSGKTTFINILNLLQNIQSGKVTFDGVESSKIDMLSWRGNIGFVSQDVVMFDGTITQNITMNFSNEELSSDNRFKIMDVCELVGLTNLVKKLPNGLGFQVGENGANLSGGQCQRLNLARELYREKAILILDEPTSSLDEISEFEIGNLIEQLKGKKTLIIISHSENLLAKLDRKVTFEDGFIKADIVVNS